MCTLHFCCIQIFFVLWLFSLLLLFNLSIMPPSHFFYSSNLNCNLGVLVDTQDTVALEYFGHAVLHLTIHVASSHSKSCIASQVSDH
jgi:extradiol dioxygenase family protein